MSKNNSVDINRLNRVISEKKEKINQLYMDIGQAYFQRHMNDRAQEETQKITQVKILLVEIAQCQKEIERIKGIKRCPSCGAVVSQQSTFCEACGTLLKAIWL